jgi:hypothetical protein
MRLETETTKHTLDKSQRLSSVNCGTVRTSIRTVTRSHNFQHVSNVPHTPMETGERAPSRPLSVDGAYFWDAPSDPSFVSSIL